MYTSEGRGLALRHNVTFAEVSVAEAAAELCEVLDRAVLRSWRDAASQSASQAARDGHEKTRRPGDVRRMENGAVAVRAVNVDTTRVRDERSAWQ